MTPGENTFDKIEIVFLEKNDLINLQITAGVSAYTSFNVTVSLGDDNNSVPDTNELNSQIRGLKFIYNPQSNALIIRSELPEVLFDDYDKQEEVLSSVLMELLTRYQTIVPYIKEYIKNLKKF